jgi:LysM repeat protein
MRVFLIVILTGVVASLYAQNRLSRSEYIDKYKDISMQEMKRSGIPASITLAQGIIESGSGNSRLATKANNHFGIKCHDWKGPSVKHDDDAKNECFRKYKNAEQSYKDHSDFLTGKSRYAGLFELAPNDYKGWARGLKKAGYATSPTYAKALINTIEELELYKYDKIVLSGIDSQKKKSRITSGEKVVSVRQVKFNNRIKYILAKENDSFEKLAEELYMMSWQLPRYNEMPRDKKLNAGEIIYLQPKRNKANRLNKTHTVKQGEVLHDISQKYGVKEYKLRERNNIPNGAEPKAGVVILLRKSVNSDQPLKDIINTPKRDKEERIFQNNKKETETEEFEIEYDLGS